MQPLTQPGHYVRAIRPIESEYFTESGTIAKQFHAEPQSIGVVLEVRPGYWPTILWESTDTVCDAIPGEDFVRVDQ